MSHSIFQAYDEEFTSLTKSISKEMVELKAIEDSDEEDSSVKLRMVDALIKQSMDLMKQMEIEVRSQDGQTRSHLGEKLVLYRKALKSQQSDYEAAKAHATKMVLLGRRGNGNGGGSDNSERSVEQERLLGVNDKMYRQNEMILTAQRTVFETEETGADIVNELSRNREKIESAQERAKEFIGSADGARRLIGTMQRRDQQHKFLMYTLLVLLLFGFIGGVYYASTSD